MIEKIICFIFGHDGEDYVTGQYPVQYYLKRCKRCGEIYDHELR